MAAPTTPPTPPPAATPTAAAPAGTKPGELVAQVRALLDATQRITNSFGRDDLTDRVDRARQRLEDPDLRALVVGEFKQGKSSLVNALLNAPVCPVADDVATVVPTVVRHGAEPGAEVVMEPGTDAPPDRFAIPIADIPAWASEHGNPENERAVRAVEVRLPRRLLGSGIAFVDTPGVGGLHSVHGAATTAALGMAEVVLFVTDASAELSAYELGVLEMAAERCPNVICVLTKIDLYPSWRRIAELDRGHLARAGLAHLPLVSVSSVLRNEALSTSSKELNEESGYAALLRHIQSDVIDRAQVLAVRTAASDARVALDQIEHSLTAEREILTDPTRAQAVLDELAAAKGRAEQLRAQTARWQQTLNDGTQDLASEIDHDLRRRVRTMTAELEESVEATDPIKIWDDLVGWLRQQAAVEVANHYDELRRRADDLAGRVAAHFAIDEAAIVHPIEVPRSSLPDAELNQPFERDARGSGALAAARGSYGGLLMFGMVGQMVGMTLLNPFTAFVGIGLGRRALKDEKKRRLTMRQQMAKQSARRYLDEVAFTVGKQSRDAMRQVQRELRDEFALRAEEVQRSMRESLVAAEAAAKATRAETEERRRTIDAELERITKTRSTLEKLELATNQTATVNR
jgi:hypothetical protein